MAGEIPHGSQSPACRLAGRHCILGGRLLRCFLFTSCCLLQKSKAWPCGTSTGFLVRAGLCLNEVLWWVHLKTGETDNQNFFVSFNSCFSRGLTCGSE